MKMHGFVADAELGQLRSSNEKVLEDEPYLDMTEGFAKIQLNPQHFTDYLDMSLGKDSSAAQIPTSNADVGAAAAGDGGVSTGEIRSLSVPVKSVDGSDEHYMEMSFNRTSAPPAIPAISGDRSIGALSSASSCSSSSASSVNSQSNFSTTTISNLTSPMTASGEYMTMSFSPCDRFS